ncbi:MAG: putative metal-dependent hydrolase [Acidobacteriaceae bacterium]|nr:putative metal-dependent hydrolase [Acidobacteriaceae bacterium]
MTSEFDPRFPIGQHEKPETVSADDLASAVATISELPEQLRAAVTRLDDDQLDTPYRDGGWTLRQVVHHVADSHAMALIRFKKALTEDNPVVFAYKEAEYAKLDDYNAPVEWSLDILENTHARWVMLMESMTAAQWKRAVQHPERGLQPLDQMALLYSWHSRHHTAHITHLRRRKRW